MIKKILVPIDGSELSDGAVRYAMGFARLINAQLLFCMAEPKTAPWLNFGFGAIVDPEALKAVHESSRLEAEKVLNDAVQLAQSAELIANSRLAFHDHPYEAIIDVAETEVCDLIIMASHGRRGVSGMLLGSETQKVLTHSAIPVLVYRNLETA